MESDIPHEDAIADYLRRGLGAVTLADVAHGVGASFDEVERDLRAMLSVYRSHLSVDDNGELLYHFELPLARRQPRGSRDLLARALPKAKRVGRLLAKGLVVSFLVGYSVLFCWLFAAVLVARLRKEPQVELSSLALPGFAGALFDLLVFWDPGELEYALRTPEVPGKHWRHDPDLFQARYAQQTYRTRHSRRDRVYDAAFAFLFGPERPELPTYAQDAEWLRFIDGQGGVVCAADLRSRTALPETALQAELTRWLIDYRGEIEVDENGFLLYVFPNARLTAVEGERAPAAWQRFEGPRHLLGNSKTQNLMVGGLALFTFVGALFAPLLVFPILNVFGAVPMALLCILPALVSLLFFVSPVLRRAGVQEENNARRHRNLRRAVLLEVFRAVEVSGTLRYADVTDFVRTRLVDANRAAALGGVEPMGWLGAVTRAEIEPVLDEILAELGADLRTLESGETEIDLRWVKEELGAAQTRRSRGVRPQVANVVYSSNGTDELMSEVPRPVEETVPEEAPVSAAIVVETLEGD